MPTPPHQTHTDCTIDSGFLDANNLSFVPDPSDPGSVACTGTTMKHNSQCFVGCAVVPSQQQPYLPVDMNASAVFQCSDGKLTTPQLVCKQGMSVTQCLSFSSRALSCLIVVYCLSLRVLVGCAVVSPPQYPYLPVDPNASAVFQCSDGKLTTPQLVCKQGMELNAIFSSHVTACVLLCMCPWR